MGTPDLRRFVSQVWRKGDTWGASAGEEASSLQGFGHALSVDPSLREAGRTNVISTKFHPSSIQ